jgi:hypothetical protein
MWVRGGGVMQVGLASQTSSFKNALIADGLFAHEP